MAIAYCSQIAVNQRKKGFLLYSL